MKLDISGAKNYSNIEVYPYISLFTIILVTIFLLYIYVSLL